MSYNKEWCDERHEKIDVEFKIMRNRMNGLDRKYLYIIILLAMNLGGISILGFLVKALAK